MVAERERNWSAATAAARLEASYKRVGQSEPGTAHVFTEIFAPEARAQAEACVDGPQTPLTGALVSVKDLFDVEGYVTRAGSAALIEAEPAQANAPSVERLVKAGAVLVGHSNQTELAYSGIGMNPYFGTPANVLYPGTAPGGSTSGGGISVGLGLCDIALGSDTGGSLRIPAAFNGLVGFKPTQASVPRGGGIPLSTTLDSFGPIARSVADCAEAWRVLADVEAPESAEAEAAFVVSTNFGRTELEPAVEAGFAEAMARISAAGFQIEQAALDSLDFYQEIPVWQIAAVESRRSHGDLIKQHATRMDQRVLTRIRRGESVLPEEYERTVASRNAFIDRFNADLGERFLLLPTVAILPPSLKVLADDREFSRINMLVLRNTTMGNMADSCSISLPFVTAAGETIGIMVTAPAGRDEALLAVAARLEAILAG